MASDNGIDVKISADTREFESNVKDAAEALEKIADNLDDVGKGAKDVDKVEKSISDLNTEAMQSEDKLGRTFGKGFKSKTKEAEGGLKDLKEEAGQTARETAQSFDGSTESIIGMFQEVAAQAFGGFGPAGQAAGIAAAVGIGLAVSVIQQAEQAAAESRKRVGELANELIDVGGVGKRDLAVVSENLQKIYTSADDAAKSLEEVQKQSDAVGVSTAKMARAYAGDEDALKDVIKATEQAITKERELADAATGTGKRNAASDKRISDLQAYKAELQRTEEELNRAKAVEKEYLDQGGAEIEAKKNLYSTLNEAYDQAASSVTDFVNSETGVLDVEAYLASMDQRKQALLDYQASLAASGFTTEQKDTLNSMGADAAAAWMAGYEKASPDQQAKMKKILDEMATDTSGSAQNIVEATFATPVEGAVEVKVDDASLQAAKAAIASGIDSGTYKIKIQAVDRYGRVID